MLFAHMHNARQQQFNPERESLQLGGPNELDESLNYPGFYELMVRDTNVEQRGHAFDDTSAEVVVLSVTIIGHMYSLLYLTVCSKFTMVPMWCFPTIHQYSRKMSVFDKGVYDFFACEGHV